MADNTINNESLSGAIPSQGIPNTGFEDNQNKGITDNVGGAATSVFDVNKLIVAAQNYNAINSIANQMLGYDVKWFRAVPQQRSKDVIFQEYTLSNVEECPLSIKVVIPSGGMPDSKYNYDLGGLEYEIPTSIEIDKKYWESIAGFGTAPQKKDIVYFIMPNKLYQVESAYLYRGFMEQETTWKLNLRKYMPEASRREGVQLQETIDKYTVSTEEIFGGAIDSDVGKLVDDKQFSQFNGTSQDKYKSYDVSLNTISKSVEIYGTVVAQSFYDMQSSNWYNPITYSGSDVITTTSDRSILAWVCPRTIPSIHKEYNVNSIIKIADVSNYDIIYDPSTFDPSIGDALDASLFSKANYMINLINPPLLSDIQLNDNIIVYRSGALNLYAKIVAISTNPLYYHCIINPFVLEDLETDVTDWNTKKGYKLMVKEPISILDGVNDFNEHVFSVNIYANQYIAINYGHTYSDEDAFVVKMDDKLNDDEWYGIVVNIGNTWKQYNVYVWKKHETDKNSKLQNIFYETLRLYPENIGVDAYSINKSPCYLTNIRLFNATIEEERQSNELLSYFSKDGDKLIIGDNADSILRIPYVTKQR